MNTKMLKGKTSLLPKFKISTLAVVTACWIALLIVFSCLSPYFFRFNNLMNLMQYCSVSGIAACGFMLVILSGALDLSVGMVSALSSVYAARATEITGIWWFGMLIGVLTGITCGCLNGILVTKMRVNPLIATLGTNSIFQGIASLENKAVGIPIYNEQFKFFGQGYIFGGKVPVIVVIMIVSFILFHIILTYTKFGREVYSVGGNAQASYVSGINVMNTRFKIFLICSTMCGLSGVLFGALTGTGVPNANINLAMDSTSATILGGASLGGGRGKIIGTVVGVLMMATITNGLTILGISTFYQMIARGSILLLAVYLDSLKDRKA